jgi:hypothetical protein
VRLPLQVRRDLEELLSRQLATRVPDASLLQGGIALPPRRRPEAHPRRFWTAFGDPKDRPHDDRDHGEQEQQRKEGPEEALPPRVIERCAYGTGKSLDHVLLLSRAIAALRDRRLCQGE